MISFWLIFEKCGIMFIVTDNKTLNEIRAKIAEKKDFLKKTYGVQEIGVFGSIVRGEDTPLSDVDLLFDIGRNRETFSLFDMADMKSYLENLLGKSVDVVDKINIRPLLKERILKETIII